MTSINFNSRKKFSSAKEVSDNIELLFPRQKNIKINNNDIKRILISFLKKLYYKISDRRVYDLSILTVDRALAFLKRIDLSRSQALKVLKTSVRHKNKKVILKGIEILKQIRTIDSRKVICTTLYNKDKDIVLAAIDALRLFKNQDITKPLASCLIRKDKTVALAALWALAEIKTPESIKAIETVFDYNNEDLKKTALWILKGNKNHKSKKRIQA